MYPLHLDRKVQSRWVLKLPIHLHTTTPYLTLVMKEKKFYRPQQDSNLQRKKKNFLWMEGNHDEFSFNLIWLWYLIYTLTQFSSAPQIDATKKGASLQNPRSVQMHRQLFLPPHQGCRKVWNIGEWGGEVLSKAFWREMFFFYSYKKGVREPLDTQL